MLQTEPTTGSRRVRREASSCAIGVLWMGGLLARGSECSSSGTLAYLKGYSQERYPEGGACTIARFGMGKFEIKKEALRWHR